MHPEFHVSALRAYQTLDEGRSIDRPGPVEGTEEYELEEILAERRRRGKRQFLIKWRGYDAAEATRESETNLANAQEALSLFRARIR